MVIHQTPSLDTDTRIRQICPDQSQIDVPVPIAKEHSLPVHAPLRDVIKNAGLDRPCLPWHDYQVFGGKR
jgi:hypothetical protein